MTLDCEKVRKERTVKGHFFLLRQDRKMDSPKAAPTHSVYQMQQKNVNENLYIIPKFSVLYK